MPLTVVDMLYVAVGVLEQLPPHAVEALFRKSVQAPATVEVQLQLGGREHFAQK